jgi:hypothetical protein
LLAAAAIFTLGVFINVVHLGNLVRDDDVGVFRSRYTGDQLRALSADRATRWRTAPPPMTLHRFSREDQYLAEALWHVRARNGAWAVDVTRAWYENRVLEKYFAPVLDVRSYLTPDGVRWPETQRIDAQTRATTVPRSVFVSHADPDNFVLLWPRAAFWAVISSLIMGLTFLARAPVGRT